MSPQLRRASITALLVVVLAGAVAGFASGSGSTVQTVHVVVVKTHTESLDLGSRGKSPGDVYVFDGTITAANGRTVIGRLRGTQTEIKLEHGVETVQGMLTYELGTGNEIVVGGLSAYPRSGTGLIKGKTFVRPVLGGTGKYAGASGTVVSKQLSGGSYDQVFRLTS
jgi:hypothetical protein